MSRPLLAANNLVALRHCEWRLEVEQVCHVRVPAVERQPAPLWVVAEVHAALALVKVAAGCVLISRMRGIKALHALANAHAGTKPVAALIEWLSLPSPGEASWDWGVFATVVVTLLVLRLGVLH